MDNVIFERPNLQYDHEATLRTLNTIGNIKNPSFDQKKIDPRYVKTIDSAFDMMQEDEKLLNQKAYETKQRECDRVRTETSESSEESNLDSDQDSNTVVLSGDSGSVTRRVNYIGFLNHQYSKIDEQLQTYLQELSEARDDLTYVLHRLTEVVALTTFDHNHRKLDIYSVNGNGLYEFHAEFPTLADLRIVHVKSDIPYDRFKDPQFFRWFMDEKAALVGTNSYLATNPGRYCSHRSLLERAYDESVKAMNQAREDLHKNNELRNKRIESFNIFREILKSIQSVE